MPTHARRPALTHEQWTLIGELFDLAVDAPPGARAQVVAGGSGGDPTVEAEVHRLLALDDSADSFLEAPLFNAADLEEQPTLGVGELVADRFEVVRLIGRGGMGEVYEAVDRELREPVALKVMRATGLDPRRMTERFRREVQLARRISHPSVCRVHDVATHRSTSGHTSIVLTMELLAGETLGARMRRGPMPVAEVLDIARQLTGALDSAHASGVVHRDIKPGNIMLLPQAGGGVRAVLTDFGLASATRTGERGGTPVTFVFGTPEYLAPEQLRGEAPTRASDLYALALVLFEMLTGSRPHAENLLARASAPPPAPSSLRPELGAMDRVFARALAPEVSARFSDGASLYDALESAARTTVSPLRRWSRRRSTRVGLTAVALAVALLVAGFRYLDRATPSVPPASQLLLNAVLNGTGDADLEGVTEVLRSQLSQSARFEMLPRERVLGALGQMQRDPGALSDPLVAREVALREGVSTVVFGSLSRLSSDYVLSVRIERVGARPSVVDGSWSKDFVAPGKGQIFSAVGDAAVWVRTTVGESADQVAQENRPPSDTTTTSWEALRLFTQANEAVAKGREADAVLLLEEALRFDPKFATAQTRLGDVLLSVRREREGYQAWAKAIALVDERQLTTRESQRIRSQFLEDTGDLQGAEKAYRTYVLHYPDDYRANVYLGSVLADLGRSLDAMPFFEHARRLRPKDWVPLFHLARASIDLRRFDDALNYVAALRGMGQIEWAAWLTGLQRFADGDVDAALKSVESLRHSADPQWTSWGFTVRGSWLLEQGRTDLAREEFEAGVHNDAARGARDAEAEKWLQLATVQCGNGEPQPCLASCERAVQLSPSVRRLLRAGTIVARAGYPRDARRYLQLLADQPDIPKVRVVRLRLRAEAALAEGLIQEALELFAQAADLTAPRREHVFLARALREAGDRAAARRAVNAQLDHPIWPYFQLEPEYPGSWSDTLSTALSASSDSRDIEALKQRLSALRFTHSASPPATH